MKIDYEYVFVFLPYLDYLFVVIFSMYDVSIINFNELYYE